MTLPAKGTSQRADTHLMRIAAWNCCSGPRARKLMALDQLSADVAVVPECPELAAGSRGAMWIGANRRKGLAVRCGSAFELVPVALNAELPRYVVPVQVRGPVSFLLLAVWAKSEGTDRYVRGLHRAIGLCEHLIAAQPTVVLGDFNSNSIWDAEHPQDRNHSALVARLAELGLVSAYHSFHGEAQGAESRPTFFEYRHAHRPYHIDFCFLPAAWRKAIKDVAVGAHADWVGLSDHMPMVVDLDLVSLAFVG